MSLLNNKDDLKELVETLNFKEKMERSLALIKEAYEKYGDSLVVANSLGKDSVCVWDLAKKVSPKIRGFIVTTRFKPKETVEFMKALAETDNFDLFNAEPVKIMINYLYVPVR